jgi:ribonuclease HI
MSNECLEEFCDSLAPPYPPSNTELCSKHLPSINNTNSQLDSQFVLEELLMPLRYVKNTSPGLDKLPYLIFKKLPQKVLPYLLKIFNNCLSTGDIPEEWHAQEIIPILKPGKDPSKGSSYRPIALSSCALKLLEHMIKNRLDWYIESKSLCPSHQFGFRKTHSCLDNLSILTTDIRSAFEKKNSLMAAFLDINSAYDNVSLEYLGESLVSIGIPPKLIRLIHNILAERTVHIFRNDTPCSRKIFKGLPQGSVLSPILFNIYCRSLPSIISCRFLQYADDIVMYCSDKSPKEARDKLQHNLLLVHEWLRSVGLSLSPSKCQIVLFTKKRKLPDLPIVIEGNTVPQKKEVKFLGMYLDSKLSWRHHIDNIILKCEKSINVMRSITRVWWGCHPSTMRLIYNALVRSHLDYGSFLLEPLPKYLALRLDRIQFKCLRLILGAMSTSPTCALQVECGEMPLRFRRQFLSDKFLLKRIVQKDHPLLESLSLFPTGEARRSLGGGPISNGLPNLLNSLTFLSESTILPKKSSLLPIYEIPFEATFMNTLVSENIGIDKYPPNNKTSRLRFQEFISEYQDFTTIFTDGSKLSPESHVGVGICIPSRNIDIMHKLPSTTSVFTAEMFGIKEAINMILPLQIKKALILSDSLSSIKCINGNVWQQPMNRLVCEIRQEILNVRLSGSEVWLAWIPSHQGITGNERADHLAKSAVFNGTIPTPFFPSVGDTSIFLKSRPVQCWNLQWENPDKGKHYKLIQPNIPQRPWFSNGKYQKSSVSIISRMRLGHCLVASHLFKIGLVSDPYCECGMDVETLDHVLFGCPISSNIDFYHSMEGCERPFNIAHLLSLNSKKVYKQLAQAGVQHSKMLLLP